MTYSFIYKWPPKDKTDLPKLPSGTPWRPFPHSSRPPVTFTGNFEIEAPERHAPTGQIDTEDATSSIRHQMANAWAQQALFEMHLYYHDVQSALWMDWANDKMEEWLPSLDELREVLARIWVRGPQIANAAHQAFRLMSAACGHYGQDLNNIAKQIRILRNAVIYLDDQNLMINEMAAKDLNDNKYKAINKLSLGMLRLSIDESFTIHLLDVTEVKLDELFNQLKEIATTRDEFELFED